MLNALRRIKPELVFIGLLVILAFYYKYHQVLLLRPVSIHQWRNCICASFAANYYYGGNFFTTQTNALLADGTTSDVAVVEFPLIYYIVSVFYRIFGKNELLFRLFQVLIGFTGLTALFKASRYFTKDWIYAGFIPLIVFTSPIYVFYLNNFIPDAAALSLAFVGFYYFTRYLGSRRLTPWLISMGFFTLSGLIKTSSLLPYLAIGTVALIELVEQIIHRKNTTVFKFRAVYIGAYLAGLLLIVIWYAYARNYSDVHGGDISPVAIRPIWKLNSETIGITYQSMRHWFRSGTYHSKYFLIISAVLLLITLIFRKRADKLLYSMNIMVILGAVCFTLLFFFDMRNHDYYQINNNFLFIPLYLTLFSIMKSSWPAIYRSVWTKALLGGVIVLMALNAGKHIHNRYSEGNSYFISSSEKLRMYGIEDYLEELGITRDKKVHVTPDGSINISLYLMNRKGLTDYSPYSKLPFKERLTKMKEIGIEYVILGSREPYTDIENLDELLGTKIGEKNGTEIFKLQLP